jgi:hypothetical protein
MNSDFYNAHDRHREDADLLYAEARWANADHLYGMAAECGLKRIMQAFGMPLTSPSGNPAVREDRVHADGIWARFESYRSGHYQGAGYVLPFPSPFDNWKAEQRYAHQANFDLVRAQAHQAGANLVFGLVKQAQLDGLI